MKEPLPDWAQPITARAPHLPPDSSSWWVARERSLTAPIMAEIALLFGDPVGDLLSLIDGVKALTNNQQIHCQSCGRSIYGEGHANTCELKMRAIKVFNDRNSGDSKYLRL